MKTFLLLFILLSLLSLSDALPSTEIFNQITKNHPKIDKVYAKELSLLLASISKKHGIPARVYAAILMQESGYDNTKISKTRDYGIAQVNIKNLNSMKVDPVNVVNNLELSLELGAEVLALFYKQFGTTEISWFTRYNCGYLSKDMFFEKHETYFYQVARYL